MSITHEQDTEDILYSRAYDTPYAVPDSFAGQIDVFLVLTNLQTKDHTELVFLSSPALLGFNMHFPWILMVISHIPIFNLHFNHFSFSRSSRATQMAAIRDISTPGAIVTKYCHVSACCGTSNKTLPTVCLLPKISRALPKLRLMDATGLSPSVMFAERSNQSPLSCSSIGVLSAALMKVIVDFDEPMEKFPLISKL